MGDIARVSIEHEDSLYSMFGVNAELLIDHAWGWEPVTIGHIKAYKPETRSMSSGQVLSEPYTMEKARVVVREMAENIALELVEKKLVANHLTLTIGYDASSLNRDETKIQYSGRVSTDYYGRKVPYHGHGTSNLGSHTSSASRITAHLTALFDRIVNPVLLIRRLTVSTNNVVDEDSLSGIISTDRPRQLRLFEDNIENTQPEYDIEKLKRERKLQEAVVGIKKAFGKNAVCKGVNFANGATQLTRNQQIGGHKA